MPRLALLLEPVPLSFDVDRGSVVEKIITAPCPIALKAITLNFAPASMQRPARTKVATIQSGDLRRVVLVANEDFVLLENTSYYPFVVIRYN
jgi:hypothetical protein